MAEKTLQERIGRRLRIARNERGISLEGMTRLGLSGAYISKIESGEHDVRVSTLLKLASALNVTPGELLNGL